MLKNNLGYSSGLRWPGIGPQGTAVALTAGHPVQGLAYRDEAWKLHMVNTHQCPTTHCAGWVNSFYFSEQSLCSFLEPACTLLPSWSLVISWDLGIELHCQCPPLTVTIILMVLGFQLGASLLLDRHSTTCTVPLALFCSGYFRDRVSLFAQSSWDCDLLILYYLPSLA
jgi:hypothetical protein